MGTPQDLVALEILTSIAGPEISWRPGQIVDLPPEDAAKWADGERARYLNPPAPDTEQAAAASQQPATTPAADAGQTATPVAPPPVKKAAKAAAKKAAPAKKPN